MKEYQKQNLNLFRLHNQRRKAKLEGLEYTLSVDEYKGTLEAFSNQCSYCGIPESRSIELYNEKLHQEHFIALSKGGGYTRDNIIPACKSCNSSKNNSDFFEWYPIYEHYSKEREQFILEYLGYEQRESMDF